MRKLVLLLGLALLFGCGGGSPLDVGAPDPGSPNLRVFGRVSLDEPLAEAALRFETPDGAPLLAAGDPRTDASGAFIVELPPGTADFRVLATRDGETFASEVRGHDGSLVVVSPLTNLASAHLRTHPGETLAEAEAAVRSLLGLPPDADLRFAMVHRSHREGFQARRYLALARSGDNRSQDGLSPFVGQIMESDGSLPNGVFSGSQGTNWELTVFDLGVSVIGAIVEGFELPGAPFIGWVLSALGSGLEGDPNEAEFRAIAQDIELLTDEVKAILTALEAEIKEDTFTIAFNADNDFALLDGLVLQLQEPLSPSDSTQNPGISSQARQALALQLSAPEVQNIITQVNLAQLGTGLAPGLLELAGEVVGLPGGGYYSNPAHFDPMVSEFNYFAARGATATMLVVEGFHALEPPEPALARTWYDLHKSGLALASTAVPQPLSSDDLFYDRVNGRIFYLNAMGSRTLDDAKDYAKSFSEGGYKSWRVATTIDVAELFHGNGTVADLQAAGLNLKATQSANSGSSLNMGFGDGAWGDLRDGSGGLALWSWATWSGSQKRPFFLVTDAEESLSQELLVPLGQLKSIEIRQTAPDQVSAYGTYEIARSSDTDPFDSPGSFTISNVDITDLVQWSSSNVDTLRVQNPPSVTGLVPLGSAPVPIRRAPGVITWLRSGSATVTARAFEPFSPGLPAVTATLALTNESVPAPRLVALRLGPKNVILNQPKSVTPLSLLGFYNDGSNRNVSGATFTTTNPGASVVEIAGALELNVSVEPPAMTPFVVTATSDGVSTSTTFYLNVP